MRVIVAAKLNTGTLIHIVCIVDSKDNAAKTVLKYNKKLLPDSNLYINDESQIISIEEWENERVSSDQSGKKDYLVSFFMNKQAQNLNIKANSVKSAYNNIRLKYGIQKDVLMFIYEMNQSRGRKSAYLLASKTVYDINKTYKLLLKAAEKAKQFEEFNRVEDKINTLFALIMGYIKGDYKYIHGDKIISSVACVLYFLSPKELVLDVVPGVTDLTDYASMEFLIGQMNFDIDKYQNWVLLGNKGEAYEK